MYGCGTIFNQIDPLPRFKVVWENSWERFFEKSHAARRFRVPMELSI
jgi:hypothetical protein